MEEAPLKTDFTSNQRWEYSKDFSGEMIGSQIMDLERRLFKHNFDKLNIKKIIRIYIELAQNIQMHSVDPGFSDELNKVVSFEIDGKHLKISASNIMNVHQLPFLKSKVDKINSSTHDKLHEMYVDTLKQMRDPAPRGAGLGLIDIARKIKAPIDLHVESLNDEFARITLSIVCK